MCWLSGAWLLMCFCFFQAEDGIRVRDVTGVQNTNVQIISRFAPILAHFIFQQKFNAVNTFSLFLSIFFCNILS